MACVDTFSSACHAEACAALPPCVLQSVDQEQVQHALVQLPSSVRRAVLALRVMRAADFLAKGGAEVGHGGQDIYVMCSAHRVWHM